jgi:hypothetical protein
MKLTKPQFNIIVELLSYQMMGYYIAMGKRYNYNNNKLSVMKMKESFGNGRRIYRDMDSEIRVGNGVHRNTFERAEVLKRVAPTSEYDEFYYYGLIDFPKLLKYDQGEEVVIQALKKIKEHK